ncbi:MAG TPA: hypothetical protein DGP89_02175 [Saprospirales bacterium]|jgi:hypothetical protein|nr:hypothetical protein [Saprospirales bacterium]
MYQFLLAIILALGLSTYWLWNENATLTQNNAKLESAVQLQEEAISSLQNDFTLQTGKLNELQLKSQEAQKEMNRYLDIFKRHSLTKLAAAKPGLIEPRVNKATKEVFDGIEQDSRDIDAADDGIIVQPTANQDIRG